MEKELVLRKGADEAQLESNNVAKEITEAQQQLQIEKKSTVEHIQQLEYKVNVAAGEIARWTDNSFVMVQYAKNDEKLNDVGRKYENIEKQFPYLSNFEADCLMLGTEEPSKRHILEKQIV